MKRFIGGILIIAMLSQPGYLVYGAVAFKLDKNSRNEITCFIDEDSYSHFINGYFNKIDSTSYELYSLLEEKKRLAGLLDERMSCNARDKIKLTNSQIKAYKSYMTYTEQSTLRLRSLLFEINDLKKLADAQKELLKVDTNYSTIIDDLAALHNKHEEAIKLLRDMIVKGSSVLTAV